MNAVLRQYIGLPVPEHMWTASEWAALEAATHSPDMNQRWVTAFVDGYSLLVRGRRPIFQASVAELPDGGRRLVELACEGDPNIWNRGATGSDVGTVELFIGASQGLIDRYQQK